MRRLLLATVLSLVLVGVTAWGLARGWWRVINPDPARFPIWGVDVSHHQGAVDWPTLAQQPMVRFAYLKATEGADWVDPRFRENWDAARSAGLKVGAYHFFTFCSGSSEQARHFLAVVPVEADALPPVVDVEIGGNCARQPERATLRLELLNWLVEIERGTDSKPIVYVTPEAYDAFLAGSTLASPLWIRSLFREPRLDAGHTWAFWQFANRARLADEEIATIRLFRRHVLRAVLTRVELSRVPLGEEISSAGR